MFGNSWRVGRLFGVEIRIDASWTVIALLVAYSLFLRFDLTFETVATEAKIALAVGSAVLFFGSVLVHELAHALVAQNRGIPVKGITLFLFGGATHSKVEARGPGAEFVIAVVGPLTSLALGGVFGGLAVLGRPFMPESVVGGLGYLAFVNVLLAVFNLVPGFPLDGGRVLRAAVWRATGSVNRATRVASLSGQGVGYLLVGGGLFLLFAGGVVGGIWLAAIGWFLANAARMSYAQLQVRRMLEEVDAEDLMAGNLLRIPGEIPLQEAVDRYFMRYDHGAFPVEERGATVGLLTLRRVKSVPRDEWDTRRVREVMGELDDLITVNPDTPMDQVVTRLEGDARRVLVTRNGEIVGIITPSDVARWLQRRQALEEV